jgi:hypothetical protein
LSCADLHVVIMGERVNGLVHTSKIYGILATGLPYVFIGPAKSHIPDLQRDCPHGYHVEHGQTEALLEVIERARRLTDEERREIAEKNIEHVASHYTPRVAMHRFVTDVLETVPPGWGGRRPAFGEYRR